MLYDIMQSYYMAVNDIFVANCKHANETRTLIN